MRVTRPVGLNVWLAGLVLGALLPLLLFAGATLYKLSKDTHAVIDRGHADTTRALALAVDGEVRSWKAALTALAASKSLRPGRLAEFYEEARQVAAPHEGWIVLTMASGDQLLNTLRPYGAPLYRSSSPETIEAVFRDGKPIVSDIVYGRNAQSYLVAVAVPVVRSGMVVYCLTLNFSPQRLSRLLQGQQFPPSWVAAINDRQHRVVARSRDVEQRIGQPVVPWLADAEETTDHGILIGPLMDGRPGQVAIRRLQEVPWHVVLAVPVDELPSSRPLLLFILGGIVVGVGAVGVALYAGRRITDPVVRLAAVAERMLRGESADFRVPSGIREVEALQRALGDASVAVRDYYQERERAVVAEEETKTLATSERILRESAERLQLFIAHAPAAIAMFDGEMRYLAVSRRWMSDYGLGNQDVIGLSHYAVFPDIPEAWKAVHQRALAGEVVRAAKDRFARADGTALWLRWEVRPWHTGAGAVGGIVIFTEDITERREAERHIEAARAEAETERAFLEAVMEALPVGVAITDMRGGNLRSNRAYEEIWGGPLPATREVSDYAAYQAWWAETGAPVLPEEWASARAVREGVAVVGQLLEIQGFDGRRRFVMNSGAPVRDAAGAIVGCAVAIQDITDLRRAEAALQSERAFVSAVLQTVGALVTVLDREGRVVSFNRACEVATGYAFDDVRGRCFWDFLLLPEDVQPVRRVFAELRAGHFPNEFENFWVARDGTRLRIHWTNSCLTDSVGAVEYIIGCGVDITERRRLEEETARLASFPMLNPQPIVEAELDGRVNFLNPAARQLFPDLAQRGVDHPWLEGWAGVAQGCRDGAPLVEREVTVGERAYLQVLQYVPEGGRIRIYGRDITERRRAEAALLQAYADLERRVRERTAELARQSDQLRALAFELTLAEQRERRRLARLLHDELQQLLVAARLRVHSLERGVDLRAQAVCREVVDLLQEALEHSRSLTRELSPSILQSGDLGAALEWLARWMAEKHHLTVSVRVNGTGEPESEDLTTMLFQSVRELLFNIVKHAEVATAEVALSRRNDVVQIVVSDTGVGFDPAALRGEGGSAGGFGIFSIRQRLELLGGRLTIDSAPGRGSRCALWVPLTQPSPASRGGGGIVVSGSPETIRILVVDDHSVTRQGLVRLFEAEPDMVVVGEAGDGQTALVLARQLMPDVVTMDINMPGISGIRATQLLRGECPGVRVIGLSMFDEAEQAATMRDAGATAYIAKSGSAEGLLAAIRAAAASKREAAGA
jgi:PAS domain S-box-containing protein